MLVPREFYSPIISDSSANHDNWGAIIIMLPCFYIIVYMLMFSDKNKSMIHPFLADPSGAKETEDTGRIFTKLLTLYFRVVEL